MFEKLLYININIIFWSTPCNLPWTTWFSSWVFNCLTTAKIVWSSSYSKWKRPSHCCCIFRPKKTFDTADHQILLNTSYHYGIRGVANDFLRSYLNNRKQFVFVNQQRPNLNTIKCGVPQGSTLGPMLFLIFINDLPVITKGKFYLFANDTTLLLSHNNTAQLEFKLNFEIGW